MGGWQAPTRNLTPQNSTCLKIAKIQALIPTLTDPKSPCSQTSANSEKNPKGKQRLQRRRRTTTRTQISEESCATRVGRRTRN
jgi:hypothetical protein